MAASINNVMRNVLFFIDCSFRNIFLWHNPSICVIEMQLNFIVYQYIIFEFQSLFSPAISSACISLSEILTRRSTSLFILKSLYRAKRTLSSRHAITTKAAAYRNTITNTTGGLMPASGANLIMSISL